MNKLVVLFVLLVMLSACGGAPKQSEATDAVTIPEGTIPFTYNRHLLFDAVLSDSIPCRLLFDTGNTHLVLDKSFYAEQIGDRVPLIRSMLGGAGDGMESARLAMHEWRYRVGEEEMIEPMAVVLNLRGIVGDGVDGMFGMHFMRGRRVAFDYADGYMQMLASTDSIPADYQRIPCTWLDETRTRIILPLAVTFGDGSTFEGRFLVDMGMPDALLMTSTTANRLKLKERLADATLQTNEVGGIGGASVEYAFTAQRMAVGGLGIDAQPALWSENEGGSLADVRYDGLVGNAFLANFEVIFDFAECVIYLRENS